MGPSPANTGGARVFRRIFARGRESFSVHVPGTRVEEKEVFEHGAGAEARRVLLRGAQYSLLMRFADEKRRTWDDERKQHESAAA